MENDANNNEKRSSNELHPVHEYFDYNVESKTSICKVADCSYSYIGRHSNNLSRHLQRHHKTLSEKLISEISGFHMKKKYKKQKQNEMVTVQINKREFLDGMLEVVHVNNRPYSLFKDSGITKMINPIIAACESSGESISTERESLQRGGEIKKERVRKKITEEMAGKTYSICIDLGSGSDGRSVLGINAQFKLDGNGLQMPRNACKSEIKYGRSYCGQYLDCFEGIWIEH